MFIARETKLKLVRVIISAVLRKKESDSTGKTVFIEKHQWGPNSIGRAILPT